ncbi:unnamed protein product, partial [Mesorhabditis belari]|uniref:Uncharacterized protein n=1 Tax=Mesorhabditis belari TaxID=2138241 RepID=A0AAF3J975_9BILA
MGALLIPLLLIPLITASTSSCHNSLYVRWPGVRLNFRAISSGKLSLRACQSACSLGEDPLQAGKSLECAALNHQTSVDNVNHHCDVFQPHQLQNVDGFVEADDRYSFYWKYCVDSSKKCGNDHAFTFMSDRYMDAAEVAEVRHTSSLEDCLAACLNEEKFPCRSLSFNRTDGGCHMSANNQLTKPKAIKLNNNPNFRIDYYENNCYNMSDSYKFNYECRDDGVLVSIDSKFPYTGALYGLYDFFTCRIEPKEQTKFEYFFPSPTKSKKCSDSIRYKGDDMILDVVLSTDGVEPLYFITPDDMTFQAKCPIAPMASTPTHSLNPFPQAPASSNDITADQFAASAHALFSLLSRESVKETVPVITSGIGNETRMTVKMENHGGAKVFATSQPAKEVVKVTETPKIVSTIVTTTPKVTSDLTKKPEATTVKMAEMTTTRATTTKMIPFQSSTPPKDEWNSMNVHLARAPSRPLPVSSTTTTTSTIGPPGTQTGIAKIRQPVSFDIFHNGRPVEAVVVGSRITLDFTPHFPISPSYMSVRGCQVEPIDPRYEWEKEPLPIIRDGCPADFVGLACPPTASDHGMKVSIEAFRYQTTAHVQYTCLIRVCPFAECPRSECPIVDGCDSRFSSMRSRRGLSLDEIRRALEADPNLQRQIGLPSMLGKNSAAATEQQLLALAGDHVVKRRLVVVNSEDQLRYYVRTGEMP